MNIKKLLMFFGFVIGFSGLSICSIITYKIFSKGSITFREPNKQILTIELILILLAWPGLFFAFRKCFED